MIAWMVTLIPVMMYYWIDHIYYYFMTSNIIGIIVLFAVPAFCVFLVEAIIRYIKSVHVNISTKFFKIMDQCNYIFTKSKRNFSAKEI